MQFFFVGIVVVIGYTLNAVEIYENISFKHFD